MNKLQSENTDGKQSLLNNEREVDTPDGLACSLAATTQYVYNAIHDEPQAKTIEHVCPVCCKRVLQTVIIQYYPCRCFREMCPDCDAKLEKSGTDSCDIHLFSCRNNPRQRKKK